MDSYCTYEATLNLFTDIFLWQGFYIYTGVNEYDYKENFK